MDDKHCPLCKTELEEIVVSQDRDLTWDHFERRVKKSCEVDRVDETIYYQDRNCKNEGMKLRMMTCLINNC